MDTEKELFRLNDELVESMSGLAQYLGHWFDKDGKLIDDISHANLSNMANAIFGYAMEIFSDNARRNYVIWKKETEIIEALKTRKETKNRDEQNEGI